MKSISFLCFILSVLCHGIVEAQTTKEKFNTVKEKKVYVKDLTVSALRQPEKNLEVPLAVTVLGLRDMQLKRG